MEREVCTGENGTRIVVLRDPMQVSPRAGECEFGMIEDGIMSLRCRDKKYTLRKGQAYFLRGGSDAVVTTICSGRMTVLRFSEDIASGVFGRYELCCPELGENGGGVARLLHIVRGELEERKFGYTVAVESEIKRMLLDICRTSKMTDPGVCGADDPDGFFGRLLAEIDKNYADYTFDDAARFMRLSRAYFSVVFHKYVGMTFSQYLNYVKVRSAVAMLQSEDRTSITDVSVRCGFNTIRNFNRAFRDITGYSPRTLPKDYVLAPLA